MRDDKGRFLPGIPSDNMIDITGKKFNGLTGIKAFKRVRNHSFWIFKCDCGEEKIMDKYKVMHGYTKSCGCWKKQRFTTHGLSGTRFYETYRNMVARCHNPKNKHYKNYGGRGIKVCKRWQSFINFKADMYESYLLHVEAFGEKQTLIERPNNNKGYSPKNCTWATWAEQVLNKRPQS